MNLRARWGTLDARLLQILFLGALLSVGVLLRDFAVQPAQIAATYASALATQWFWLRRLNLKQVGYLSAVVTACGLSILIRADNGWVHPLLAAVAITSKFVVRIDGRHLFNPANLGAVLAFALLPGAWLSPGQWGQEVALAGWLLMLGGIVAQRARRLDIGLVFLCAWLGLVALRVTWLGQPWAVWLHQFNNGALLLFCFFMISDPMTTPARRGARIGYAIVVALGAAAWQYLLFKPNGPVVALAVASVLVPWINRRWPGTTFQWRGPAPQSIGPPLASPTGRPGPWPAVSKDARNGLVGGP
jgi:enediyne biosynthesis protein E5